MANSSILGCRATEACDGAEVQRDCSRRGYTTDQVLEELDRREADAEAFIRPATAARRHRDFVHARGSRRQEHPDAELGMRRGLVHPQLSAVVGVGGDGVSLVQRESETSLWVSGTISRDRSAAIEQAVWDRLRSPGTCAPSAWASSRSAPSSIAPRHLRPRSCSCSTSSSPPAQRSQSEPPMRADRPATADGRTS
jgi:hypothetical protein